MADDDLFDDENSDDFDPFSGMEGAEDKPSRKSGGSSKSAGGTRTLADFGAEVDRRIAVLRSLKQKPRVRAEAAAWLGESGDIRAIKALVQVYSSRKSGRAVRGAAKRALSKFKALDVAIDRMEGEEVEAALGREENAWVIELLQDLAYNERAPRRRGRTILLMNGVLAVLLALLIVVYQAAPTDAVSINDIVKNLGIGATAVPLPTATPRIDAQGTPLATFTPLPTATATPEPTATTVSQDNVRALLREMYAVLSIIDTQRGPLDQLNINWTSIQTDPSAGPRLCIPVAPDVPPDIALAAGFNEANPSLGFARDAINGGLARLREAWTDWRTGCAAGDLPGRIAKGLQDILVMRDAFNTARSFLDLVPQ